MSSRSAFSFAGNLYRRDRSRGGAVTVFAAVGLVCGAIAWSMSVQDPYWKLFGSTSQPAPIYEPSAPDAGAQAFFAPGPGNPETAAMSPEPAFEDPAHAALILAAEAAKLPEPTLASIPPVEGLETSGQGAPALRAAFDRPSLVEPGAFLPEPWAAVSTGGETAGVAPSPFVSPDAPVQPRMAATPETEEALRLDRDERAAVQRRLALAGFDPRGFDGIFGPNTRRAISDFQTAWDFPATGYLEETVHAELSLRTEDAYQAMRNRSSALASAKQTPDAREAEIAAPEGKCARRADGRIVPGQSLGCDMAGFAQQFATMGRNVIDKDDDAPSVAVTQAPSPQSVPRKPDR